MMARKLIYISGPLSNGGKLDDDHQIKNVSVAMKAAADLMEAGFSVICPHLTWYLHAVYPQPYERWIDCDLVQVSRCDAVLRIRGKSLGSDKECLCAVDLDIPVYKTVKELIEGES